MNSLNLLKKSKFRKKFKMEIEVGKVVSLGQHARIWLGNDRECILSTEESVFWINYLNGEIYREEKWSIVLESDAFLIFKRSNSDYFMWNLLKSEGIKIQYEGDISLQWKAAVFGDNIVLSPPLTISDAQSVLHIAQQQAFRSVNVSIDPPNNCQLMVHTVCTTGNVLLLVHALIADDILSLHYNCFTNHLLSLVKKESFVTHLPEFRHASLSLEGCAKGKMVAVQIDNMVVIHHFGSHEMAFKCELRQLSDIATIKWSPDGQYCIALSSLGTCVFISPQGELLREDLTLGLSPVSRNQFFIQQLFTLIGYFTLPYTPERRYNCIEC